jgi:4-amino-4-deoxychorismate lyase
MPNYFKKSIYPFLESIRLYDGEVDLLALHQARVDKTRRLIYGEKNRLSITELLASLDLPGRGLYKIRMVYGRKAGRVDILPYEIAEINQLVLMETTRAYGLKRVERGWLDEPVKQLEDKSFPLFHSSGRIRDTNYCNVAFWNGSAWHTPLYPLLNGVRREHLLKAKVISPKDLFIDDLEDYQIARIFNAMIHFEEAPEIHIRDIRREQD